MNKYTLGERRAARSRWGKVLDRLNPTTAGLIYFRLGGFHVHLLVRPHSWVWGTAYGLYRKQYGLGPLFLVNR